MKKNKELIEEQSKTRQRRLYNFLKRRGNHYTLQKTVADCLSKFYIYDSQYDFHNSAARLQMTKDIQSINESDEYEKIIISSAQGIKLSTKREFSDYIKKEYAYVFAKLKRIHHKKKKGSMDGQIVCGVNSTDIDHIIEAFIEED